MLAATLYELLPNPAKTEFLGTMNALLPGVTVRAEPSAKCGVAGTKFSVLIGGQVESADEGGANTPNHHSYHHLLS